MVLANTNWQGVCHICRHDICQRGTGTSSAAGKFIDENLNFRLHFFHTTNSGTRRTTKKTENFCDRNSSEICLQCLVWKGGGLDSGNYRIFRLLRQERAILRWWKLKKTENFSTPVSWKWAKIQRHRISTSNISFITGGGQRFKKFYTTASRTWESMVKNPSPAGLVTISSLSFST